MLSKQKSGSDTKEEGRQEDAPELCHFLEVKENSVGAKAWRLRSAKYVW